MKTRRTRQTAKRSGFTLMEVLLVLAILGVIMAMVVPQLLGQQKRANMQAAQASIKGLEGALDFYAKDHEGLYPSTQEGVMVLISSNGNDPNWNGPYLRNTTEMPLDPWKNPLQYANPGQNNQDKPDIWSWGPDKIDGTEDDISNWQRKL